METPICKKNPRPHKITMSIFSFIIYRTQQHRWCLDIIGREKDGSFFFDRKQELDMFFNDHLSNMVVSP